MDYKEKYEQAMEKARQFIEKPYLEDSAGIVGYIFPELKENEDEKIRKALIDGFKRYDDGSLFNGCLVREILDWFEKQGKQTPNPYSGTSFEYNGHTWGMCARDGGVEILIDGHLKGRVFTNDSNAKEMFIKALERVEEQNAKGYKLTDCDKNSWWEDFKVYTSCTIEQKPAEWSEKDKNYYDTIVAILENTKDDAQLSDSQISFLKSLRPQNWTKKDKERYISCLQRLGTGNPEQPETVNSKWFKDHVYPKKQWKPNEEQIKWLYCAMDDAEKGSRMKQVLYELLEQLKKLND